MRTTFYFFLTILFLTGITILSCEGPVGPQGPKGEQGPPGPVGPAGADGSIIHAGQGEPESGLGQIGDYYLDLSTRFLYGPKSANGWETVLNLEGPQGPQGPQGPEGPQGPPGEDGEDGQDGKDGVDGAQGPQGPPGQDGEDGQDGTDGQDGADGSQIFAGNGPPDGSLGNMGDFYLDKANYDLYGPKTGSDWGTPINLQGPKGEPGPEGPAGTTDHSMLLNLDADDHTQYLLTDGVRNATDGFAVAGILGDGEIPEEGLGTRFMWYPGKGALRAGSLTANFAENHWDESNIGEHSVSLGENTMASADYSVAMGRRTTASGAHSFAMGSNTTATGSGAVATGIGTVAASSLSLTIGSYNYANTTNDNSLFVAGNGFSSTNRFDVMVLNKSGNLWIAGSLTEASDRDLKTDIRPLRMNVIDKLGNIRSVRYRFKENTGYPENEQLGLIAQEVQAHFPELVSKKGDGTLSLSYSKLTSVLLKGIQEQQEQIESLEKRLKRLEQQTGIQTAGIPIQPWLMGGLILLLCGLLVGQHYRNIQKN